MDFGCGTGISLPLLEDILHPEQIIGLDPSEKSLAVARELARSLSVQLATPDKHLPRQTLDLVFCNGVFHHIPLAERSAAINYIYRCLRPGGMFALWENNPWNPIQSFAMQHSKIDENAIPLAPGIAPACRLGGLPRGAQYQVLARKV
jgi:SAM-dependent methyltransferase